MGFLLITELWVSLADWSACKLSLLVVSANQEALCQATTSFYFNQAATLTRLHERLLNTHLSNAMLLQTAVTETPELPIS